LLGPQLYASPQFHTWLYHSPFTDCEEGVHQLVHISHLWKSPGSTKMAQTQQLTFRRRRLIQFKSNVLTVVWIDNCIVSGINPLESFSLIGSEIPVVPVQFHEPQGLVGQIAWARLYPNQRHQIESSTTKLNVIDLILVKHDVLYCHGIDWMTLRTLFHQFDNFTYETFFVDLESKAEDVNRLTTACWNWIQIWTLSRSRERDIITIYHDWQMN
jgi:hypothetical protein